MSDQPVYLEIICGGVECTRCALDAFICQGRMIERTNRQNGSTFAGCEHFSACLETRAVPEAVRLRRAGHAELPGFDCVAGER